MLVQFSKRKDGSEVLRCVRDDGSITWQKQDRQAAFFVHHDLTHYAVESTLGFRRGFYGLISEGWDIEDTTGKGPRGPLPAEALQVENLVGLLDRERAAGLIWPVEDFNQLAEPARLFSEDDLARVRALRSELFARWSALEAGETLELQICCF